MLSVLVVGGANLDIVARTTRALVTATSNPGRTRTSAGGVGRNVAANLGLLGVPTRLVTALGDDDFGARLRVETEAAGVDLAHAVTTGAPTGTYTAMLDDTGELVFAIADMIGVEGLRPRDIPVQLIDSASFVVLDGNVPAPVYEWVCHTAAARWVPLIFDPVSDPKAERLAGVLHAGPIHTVTPTRGELAALTGIGDVQAGVQRLLTEGVERVWMREGASGSTLFTKDGSHHVSAPAGIVSDVTGAGDAMTAAYVQALLAGRSESEAVQRGSAAAYLTITCPDTVRPDLSADLIDATVRREFG